MRKNILPPFIIYCRSNRERKCTSPKSKKLVRMTTTTKWRSISYAPSEKDHKTVLAFLAEERIKFSIFSRNICPKQHAMLMLFLFLCHMGEAHKISIKNTTLMVNTPFNHYKFAMHSCPNLGNGLMD
jgi:hypothetical protein